MAGSLIDAAISKDSFSSALSEGDRSGWLESIEEMRDRREEEWVERKARASSYAGSTPGLSNGCHEEEEVKGVEELEEEEADEVRVECELLRTDVFWARRRDLQAVREAEAMVTMVTMVMMGKKVLDWGSHTTGEEDTKAKSVAAGTSRRQKLVRLGFLLIARNILMAFSFQGRSWKGCNILEFPPRLPLRGADVRCDARPTFGACGGIFTISFVA